MNSEPKNPFDILLKQFNEDILKMEAAIERCRLKYGEEKLGIFGQGFMFFRINFKDIILTNRQLDNSIDPDEKNLIARTLTLHFYELLDDTKAFLGLRLREELKRLPDSQFNLKELSKLKGYYQAIKNASFQSFADVRHNAMGHKDQDAIKLNRIIKNLNMDELKNNTILIWLLLCLILKFQSNVMDSIGNLHEESQTSDEIKTDNAGNKKKSIDFEFNRLMFVIKDIPVDIADLLASFSSQEIQDLLNSTKDQQIKFLESEYLKRYKT
ncbi:MAG: hypothetical protein ABJA78_16500 [Ferruginibacter sp.]